MTTTSTNIFSPVRLAGYDIYEGDDDEIVYNRSVTSFSRKVNKFIDNNKREGTNLLDNRKINVNNSTGEFSYKSIGKSQRYRMVIRSIEDALIISAILEQRDALAGLPVLPAQFRKTIQLFNDAFLDDKNFTYKFKNELLPWIDAPTRGRAKKDKEIKNPISKRFIKVGKLAYKKTFKNIRLKKVIYDPLQNFNTIDYEIKDYCVPSYLEQNLLKKEFNMISDDLKNNPMPTYPELTDILNKIDYNLNVYTHDKDIEQEQTTHKKTLTIVIHDEHMYVTRNKGIIKMAKEIIYCKDDEFEKIKTESYTESTKICNGKKYKRINKFSEYDKEHELRNTYSKINIDFFNECGIRPARYFNENVENVESLDINGCYPNILYNQNCIIPVQDGTERTEIFDKNNDVILRHGFYWVSFKNMNDFEMAVYGSSCWILGDVIINMKLEKRIDIKFKHITKDAKNPPPKPETFNKLDLTFYSGYLAKYDTQKSIIYECYGEEALAYLDKYEDCFYNMGKFTYSFIDETTGKNDIEYKTIDYETPNERKELLKTYPDASYVDSHIEIIHEYYLKTSGLYAYLAILQYAKMQLYHIYNEVKKVNPDIKIKKIYTDSITFNKKIGIDIKKLNTIFMNKHNFTAKYERSTYQFEKTEIIIKEPMIEEQKKIIEHDDVNNLMCMNISFSVNARAGYGKTYTIKNQIIPYIKKNNKKYILTSSTTESTENLIKDGLNCEVINTTLLSKNAHIKNLTKRFNDIDYLIVDESSRLCVSILGMIEHLKIINKNLKIILVGDKNQCDFDGKNLMESDIFNRIVDYNNLSIKWHKNARYGKEYDTFLSEILKYENGGHDGKCIKYIKDFFKDQIKNIKDSKKDKNEIKITYTNKKRKAFNDEEGMTTHKSQGKTINKEYSIYEIEKMPVKVLYTSLSRCTDHKLIHIYI